MRAGRPQQALGVLKRGLALDTANAVISFNIGNAFAAQQMYARYGFVRIGTRRGYYPAHGGREDAVVMRIAL